MPRARSWLLIERCEEGLRRVTYREALARQNVAERYMTLLTTPAAVDRRRPTKGMSP